LFTSGAKVSFFLEKYNCLLMPTLIFWLLLMMLK